MIRRMSGVVLAVSILSGICWSAETTNTYDRSGQWGLGVSAGTTSPGVGGRYWFNDKFALDLGGALSLDTNNSDTNNKHQDWGTNGQFVYVFHKRDGLRVEGLLGVNYDHDSTDTQSLTNVLDTNSAVNTNYFNTEDNLLKTTTAGVGFAVEYSFQELPDLGFSAFATGFGASFVTHDEDESQYYPDSKNGPTTIVQSIHETYITLATRPSVGLSVHYYF